MEHPSYLRRPMDKFSFLGNIDVSQVDELYQKFVSDPASVDESWKEFFEGFEFARTLYPEPVQKKGATTFAGDEIHVQKEFKVINLINGYRNRGHLFTDTNPVRERRKYFPTLDI